MSTKTPKWGRTKNQRKEVQSEKKKCKHDGSIITTSTTNTNIGGAISSNTNAVVDKIAVVNDVAIDPKVNIGSPDDWSRVGFDQDSGRAFVEAVSHGPLRLLDRRFVHPFVVPMSDEENKKVPRSAQPLRPPRLDDNLSWVEAFTQGGVSFWYQLTRPDVTTWFDPYDAPGGKAWLKLVDATGQPYWYHRQSKYCTRHNPWPVCERTTWPERFRLSQFQSPGCFTKWPLIAVNTLKLRTETLQVHQDYAARFTAAVVRDCCLGFCICSDPPLCRNNDIPDNLKVGGPRTFRGPSVFKWLLFRMSTECCEIGISSSVANQPPTFETFQCAFELAYGHGLSLDNDINKTYPELGDCTPFVWACLKCPPVAHAMLDFLAFDTIDKVPERFRYIQLKSHLNRNDRVSKFNPSPLRVTTPCGPNALFSNSLWACLAQGNNYLLQRVVQRALEEGDLMGQPGNSRFFNMPRILETKMLSKSEIDKFDRSPLLTAVYEYNHSKNRDISIISTLITMAALDDGTGLDLLATKMSLLTKKPAAQVVKSTQKKSVIELIQAEIDNQDNDRIRSKALKNILGAQLLPKIKTIASFSTNRRVLLVQHIAAGIDTIRLVESYLMPL